MAGNHRRDWPAADPAPPQGEGFLARWSARKRGRDAEVDEDHKASVQADVVEPAPAEEPRVLCDADLPPLESLGDESDYRAFLSPGVSEGLQRRALQQLFHTARYQVCDGLDDYDRDYQLLQPLRRLVAEAGERVLRGQAAQGTPAEAAPGAVGEPHKAPAPPAQRPPVAASERPGEREAPDPDPESAA